MAYEVCVHGRLKRQCETCIAETERDERLTTEEADQRASAAMTSEKAVHAACRSLVAHVPTVAPGAMQAALEAAALELYGEPVGKEKDDA